MGNIHFHVLEESAFAGPMVHSIVEGVRWLANFVGPGNKDCWGNFLGANKVVVDVGERSMGSTAVGGWIAKSGTVDSQIDGARRFDCVGGAGECSAGLCSSDHSSWCDSLLNLGNSCGANLSSHCC